MPLPGTHRIKDSGSDAVQLTIAYVKQEALGPLKATGRFVAAGIAATTLLSLGTLLLLVGVLRLLQTETGSTLSGDWSWVPYVVVSLLAVVIIGGAAWRVTAGPAERRYPDVAARVAAHDTGTGAGAAGAVPSAVPGGSPSPGGTI